MTDLENDLRALAGRLRVKKDQDGVPNWRDLALRLAKKYIPDFRKPPGAPTKRLAWRLVLSVDTLIAEGISGQKACEYLVKTSESPYFGTGAGTLYRAYQLANKSNPVYREIGDRLRRDKIERLIQAETDPVRKLLLLSELKSIKPGPRARGRRPILAKSIRR
jgi:hypothetical protein